VEAPVAQLIVRRLGDEVKERLRARAKKHGRSLEAEAREILSEAAGMNRTKAASASGFGTRVSARFKEIGFTRRELKAFNTRVEKRRKERRRRVKFDE
jgi:plasmid stability protein